MREAEEPSAAAAIADLQLPRRPVPAAGGAAAAAAGGLSVGAAVAETAQEPRAPPAFVRRLRMRRVPITAVWMAGLNSVSTAESVVFTYKLISPLNTM
jgi:hypothetical protein